MTCNRMNGDDGVLVQVVIDFREGDLSTRASVVNIQNVLMELTDGSGRSIGKTTSVTMRLLGTSVERAAEVFAFIGSSYQEAIDKERAKLDGDTP